MFGAYISCLSDGYYFCNDCAETNTPSNQMSRHHYRKNILFVLYNVVVLIIMVTAIELLLMYLFQKPTLIPDFAIRHFRNLYKYTRSTIQVETACAQYDSQLFYTLKPGNCTFSNVEFVTQVAINQQGLRDSPQSLDNPEIVFLGDSFTMGWGVAQEETFPQLVNILSGKKTLNAGISSYGTAREMILLNRIDTDSMKTLVIQYHANDMEENMTYMNNRYILHVSERKFYDSLCNVCVSSQQYFPGKFIGGIGKYWVKDWINDLPNEERDYRQEAEIFLHIIARETFSPEIQIIVFELGNRNNSNQFAEAVESVIQANDYPSHIERMKILKIADVLSEEDYFILDDHLNPAGHKKIAQLLLSSL